MASVLQVLGYYIAREGLARRSSTLPRALLAQLVDDDAGGRRRARGDDLARGGRAEHADEAVEEDGELALGEGVEGGGGGEGPRRLVQQQEEAVVQVRPQL